MRISPNNPIRETGLIAFESSRRLYKVRGTVCARRVTEGWLFEDRFIAGWIQNRIMVYVKGDRKVIYTY
jgi:hypothetical protein